MIKLPPVSNLHGIKTPHFPDMYLAVIWRNWNKIDPVILAEILDTDIENVRQAAVLMGLDYEGRFDPIWTSRGYLSIIRNNWHLLEFDQICTLLGMSEEQLAILLKEDDFMWGKMGNMKPTVDRPKFRPLTEEETVKTKAIAEYLKSTCGELYDAPDVCFDFLKEFYKKPENKGKDIVIADKNGIKYAYSYFAVYGDPLLQPELDPYPDGLLKKYAECGINGVWLQGILYQLVPYPFDESLSQGWETRIKNLRDLCNRAKKYGIDVFLYLNEPRAQGEAFFEKYPHLKGANERAYHCLCTSTPEVQNYLETAAERLFKEAPELAGFFTITMSENLTNCFSRVISKTTCERCMKRGPHVVVPEVSNILTRGAKKAKPDVKSICWTWAWYADWSYSAVENINEGQIVMSNSEDAIPTFVGGVKGRVADYSISIPGPSEKAKKIWSIARKNGHETAAKVQFSNSWEMSAVPYVPVYDLVGEHIENLKEQGVKHLQLSWTLGGYPSPNLKMAAEFLKTDSVCSVYSFIEELYGKDAAPTVDRAQKLMCDAFRQFPFNITVLYVCPVNYGPLAPFFAEPSGHTASMVGFPYDDLDRWRAIYPREVFETQFKLLSEKWKHGLDVLEARPSDSEMYDELLTMARVCYYHFKSTYNQIRFVQVREGLTEERTDNLLDEMKTLIENERELTLGLIRECSHDSRIGYEASNHYMYTVRDLEEKLLNLKYCEEFFKI